MSDKLKKILIVSSYAPPAIGGPQNLYNLLRDFPTNRYAILTSFYNIDNLSARVGSWLPGEYIFYDNPSANKESTREEVSRSAGGNKQTNKIQKIKFLMKRNGFVRVLAGIPVILGQITMIVRQGKKAIRERNIDVLVGFSDYGPAMLGTYILHKITKRPFYIFLFDLYKGNFLPFPGGLLASLFERRIFEHAEKIIVTNEGTKKYYERLYGPSVSNKMIIIYNSVFPEPYVALQNTVALYDPKPPYIILFTGRIYWPQIGALQNLIEAVNEMDDIDIKFKIYSPSPKEYLKEIGIVASDKVELLVAPPQEMPKIQGNADILFLPLSWHTQSQPIIDTATPGKLTDYMIAGKPMLIHAPASSFLVEYAKENHLAAVVDTEDKEKLKIAIKKILTDKKYSEDLIVNAKKTFFENHNANHNALKFKDLWRS